MVIFFHFKYWSVVLLLSLCFISYGQNLDELSFKKGIKFNGGLSLNNQFYTGSNPTNRRDPYNFFLTGNLTVNLFGFPLPFSFSYSNVSKSYTQPFNNFKLAPKYKWIQLHVGAVNMNFSEFTLAGHRFDGVGVELTPDKWEIAAVYGRFLKAVQYDSVSNNLDAMAYQRMGYGLKLGYKGETFSVSTNFFSAKDNVKSLSFIPTQSLLTPSENWAIGVKGKKTFFKSFFIEVEYNFSILNGNITYKPENMGGSDSLVNLPESKNFLGKLLPSGPSTRSFDAISASTGYDSKYWGLQFAYKRVSPNYKTLGGYYFVEDIESFTLQPSLRLLKNKVQLSGSVGIEYNNLDGSRNSDALRLVYSPSLSWQITEKWNFSASYSNFTSYTTTRPVIDPTFTDGLDTLNFYQINQNITVSSGYSFGKNERQSTINGNFGFQISNNRSSSDSIAKDQSTFLNGGLNYGLSLSTIKATLSAGVQYNQSTVDNLTSYFVGPTIGFQQSYFEDQLSGSLNINYSQNIVENTKSVPILNSSLNLSYSPKFLNRTIFKQAMKHRIQSTISLLNRLRSNEQQPAFYELTATLGYYFTF